VGGPVLRLGGGWNAWSRAAPIFCLGRPSGFCRVITPAVPAARVAGRGGQHEPGGGFGCVGQKVGQDTGVGVGGQHDAAVPQLGLRRLEVDPGAVREAGRAVR